MEHEDTVGEEKMGLWLHPEHPEYQACSKVAMALHDELHKGPLHERFLVGVGPSDDNQRARIFVLLYEEVGQELVPVEFEGYEVKAVVTGPDPIKAAPPG